MSRMMKVLVLVIGVSTGGLAMAEETIVIDNIPKDQLLDYLAGNGNFTLIDARSEAEYEAGHIHGAVHLPHTSEAEAIEAVAGDRGSPLVVYCKSGMRAMQLKNRMTELGYRDVTVLSPNQMMWADELPVFNCGVEEPEPYVLETVSSR